MSIGSTSSLTFISGTAGPKTEERLPPTAAGGGGAVAMAVAGGGAGTAPGTAERAAAGCEGGLAAITAGMLGAGCWAAGGTAMVGWSLLWLDAVSMDTVTGVATDTWISDLGLALKHKSKENAANRKLPYPVSISEEGICPILSV